MAVFRVEKTKDFTVMSNHHLRNVSLSLKAKGLLSLMLSLPDNWDYLLNTANLDSYGFHHPEAHVVESGPVAFCGWLDHRYARPYRTEVQLYKSLLALKRSIDRDCIVTSQREALQMLRCVISNLEYRFYKAYNMEFEDKRTVYSECAFRLIPREDEPSVCLMHDWVYLPTA
jgi:hypothetical protein